MVKATVWQQMSSVVSLTLIGCLWLSVHAYAAVRLPSLFGDNMVLQRQSTLELWGWADAGEAVRVSAGWLGTTAATVAGSDGRWRVRLETGNAGGPYEMRVEGGNRIVLSNIMLGEVWVCAGQSNMEYTIRMLGGWTGSFGADREDLLTHDYASLRLFTVPNETSSVPRDTCSGGWSVAGPDAVEDFSATAYFFGRDLLRTLRVPIGLISSDWGGTPAQAWTPREALAKEAELAFYLDHRDTPASGPDVPSVLYNAMIHPLVRFPIRGVIWYQGEANRNEASVYRALMGTLIASWRDVWDLGDFPFYYVQIAPYNFEEPLSAALLREAQLKTMTVPNTGMVVTGDIGDVSDIHPRKKQEVGRRLALWALARTYGMPIPAFSGPLYRSMTKEGNAIRVSFDYAGDGLVVRKGKGSEFTVAGTDRRFADADVTVDDTTILLSSPRVSHPVAVRYAFTNTSESRLFSQAGLPASPFRTDDWPVVTTRVAIAAAYDSMNNAVVFTLTAPAPDAAIRYTLDGSEPDTASPLYSGTVSLKRTGTIRARAFQDGVGSTYTASRAFLEHRAVGKPATYRCPPDSRYPGGGRFGLVDGVTGSADFQDGSWQGFQRCDLDVTVDLGSVCDLTEIRSSFLQDQGSWIFFPRSVECSLSSDGTSFTQVATIQNDLPDSTIGGIRKPFAAMLSGRSARFVRVRARSIGVCPPWHPGSGSDAWLFSDEIVVK